MTQLVDVSSVAEAAAGFSWERLWDLFDGDEARLNIAHECLDRHDPSAVAARIAHADGTSEELTFGLLSDASSRVAHELEALGVAPGEPVGVMMEPSLGFYASVFGVLKRGAVAVPLYTLFGPDAVRDRLDDCGASVLVVDGAGAAVAVAGGLPYRMLSYADDLAPKLDKHPPVYAVSTAARDPAVLQYTSGTTRQLAEAVPHDHRSVVTLARSALFALGLKQGDRFLCPSSPAWGHGLWHGTIAPWSLGIPLGAYSGRFNVDTLVDALRDLRITNLAAASTIYRMLLRSDRLGELTALEKASYTGEELDAPAQTQFQAATGVPVCGMYGTTETGVIIVNYPGFTDYRPRPGALGRPMPGCEVAVLDASGELVEPGVVGEISVWRRGRWFGAKDLGHVDEDGFFWYSGRADDVIISAGWTISPLEVERALLADDDVLEAAVVGAPDALRGSVVKAYLVASRSGEDFVEELKQRVRTELGAHEYPRQIELVDTLPKTPSGKVNRRVLRERDRQQV